MMKIEVRDNSFNAIVDENIEFEQLGSNFAFTEGPIWHPSEKHLIFSDIPENHIRRWQAEEGITTFRQPSNMANGNTYDKQGRLLTCEHATSRVTRTERDGTIVTLATHYQGKQLNSPNDIVVKHDGDIYFTDPMYGRTEYVGIPREPELAFRGVYRIDPIDNGLTLLADDFQQPNGLCFSLDESQLFVNDTERMHIRVFDINDDGTLSNSRIWAELIGKGESGPDGMKIDSTGNLYCCALGGIHVFAPDARYLGVIHVPELPANFTWGDDDMCSLFITASTSLYRIRVKNPGIKAF